MQEDFDNVVIIDVDSDGFDNVIIVDVPESLREKLKGARRGKFPFTTVVNIDDDDDDDQQDGLDGNTASAPPGSSPAYNNIQEPLDTNGNSHRIFKEKRPAFGLSKCGKSCSKKAPLRNHYGLSYESESDSYASDSSDCEVMEGSFEELRQLWERASQKKKIGRSKGRHFGEGRASFQSDTQPNVGEASFSTDGDSNLGNKAKQNSETPIHPKAKNVGCHSSTCDDDGGEFVGDASFNSKMEDPVAKSVKKAGWENFRWWSKVRYSEKMRSGRKGHSNIGVGTNKGDHHVSNGKHENPNDSCYSSKATEQKYAEEDLFTKAQRNSQFENEKASCEDKDTFFCEGERSGEPCNLYQRRVVLGKEKGYVQVSSSCDTFSNEAQSQGLCMGEGKNVVSGNKVMPNTESSDENRPTDPRTSSTTEGIEQSDSKHTVPLERVLFQALSVVPSPAQRHVVIDRESLKETDEYKRAAEQEWAARQHQLQIQAEEAQKLRKRRKAESLRILDMEKRQKQRLEEMRETQKKDEEDLNLKERLRGEIRKELHKLEITSIDMASLLRGLGIPVAGGFHPSANDVHAAYKRALLKFHPDRVSRSDIRQLVEAEEKFKLMSRMKEKYQLCFR